MIPEQVIEQIAAANDIVDVVSSYFPLKRAGPTFKALCPFHREKSPSFSVNPARQIFKCFGCGAGGGVFKFVELYESVSFPEAVKRLGARVNIHVEEEPLTPEEEGKHRLRQRLLSLHADAAEWFHQNLLKTKAGQIARDYLKSRGLTAEVAKSWKLGFAPNSWDALTLFARDKGYREDELIASGLVTTKDEESDERAQHFYDRFRERLMFPICNRHGEVIAFSGRVLNAEAFGGKYVNSPETPIFTKGKVLFGIHKTMRAIIDKSSAIVCEGQLDLITAFEAGVQNVTASQGTAFTEDQARILKQYGNEVVLCFDSDAAGLKAAERSLRVLLAAGLSIRVAEMPAGHDPDSLIRNEGAEAFIQRIESARDFFEFQIERHASAPDFATPKGKVAFAHKMAESVALISDPLLRDAVINNVSARLEMPPSQFAALIKRNSGKLTRRPPQEARDEEEPERLKLPAMSVTTRMVCQLALLSPEARQWLLAQNWQPLFAALPDTELAAKVMAGRFDPEQPASVSAFLTTLAPEEQAILAGLLDNKQLPLEPLRVIADCWRDMVRQELQRRRDICTARLRAPGLDLAEAERLQAQVLEIQRQLTALRG